MRDIPSRIEDIKSSKAILTVELQKCRDWLSYGYSDDGWHYLSALLFEYLKNPLLSYSKSILCTYYSLFQPQALMEALFVNKPRAAMKYNGWVPLPWFRYPPSIATNYQHFGPNTKHFGKQELMRTISLYQRLSREGYRPEAYKDGYIKGYFLVMGNDYRFIVTSGQHRMAVLAMLGYQQVKVKIHPQSQRLVDQEHIQTWVNVINGYYTTTLAQQIFELPFHHNGKARAERLGIYRQIYF